MMLALIVIVSDKLSPMVMFPPIVTFPVALTFPVTNKFPEILVLAKISTVPVPLGLSSIGEFDTVVLIVLPVSYTHLTLPTKRIV